MAEPLLIAAGEQAGAGGTADRAGYVTAGATNAISCQRINVWGQDIFAALTSEVGITQIIGENEQDVWFVILGFGT